MTRKQRRRDFLRLSGGVALAAPLFWIPRAQAAQPRIVVVGGGAGGAIVAHALAVSGAGLDITLVEPKARYTTCFFSNRYIGGLRTFESLTHGYDKLSSDLAIRVIGDKAAAIDPDTRTVRLAGGQSLQWDRLVVAPGIDFRWDAIEGYGPQAAEVMPHAWHAGPQTRLLRAQLEEMPDGGTFLIAPPEEPYRCPAAPYERVSLVANYFKQVKPKSKIIILDAKSEFPLQSLFEEGWTSNYPGMIEVIPADFSGGPKAVDPSAMTVMSEDSRFKVAVANVIPPQFAGRIARGAGLADDSGWCPVHPESFESAIVPGIYVVGDSAIASPMPKAAYTAEIHAKFCSRAILKALTGEAAKGGPIGGACWSSITPDNAVREYAEFDIVDGAIKRTRLDINKTGEDAKSRAATAAEANNWYREITGKMFG